MKSTLSASFANRSASVGVIGLGYTGLPLALEFVDAGFSVVGYDVDQRVVDLLVRGRSHIRDISAPDIAKAVDSGRFKVTTIESDLAVCDAISIAVPTPLSKTRDPDMSYVLRAVDAVARQAHPGLCVVLESTTYPGTTRELLQPRLETRGLTVGVDVFVAFSPERVDPGNPVYNTKNTPKVVGGITPACVEVATALYQSCIDTVVTVGSTEAAELVKLLENTFRAVNIGLVNEIAIMCDKLGVDVWEVIDAAATKPFGFMKFTPGPGIGGHCIPLDPHYLAWKMRTLNYKTRFIDLASEINSAMPEYVVDRVSASLNDVAKAVNGSRILILGVAYKRDIDDVRESPALDVMRLLEGRGAHVEFHDPFIREFREDGHTRKGVDMSDEMLAWADAIVIITDHTGMDYQHVVDTAALVVDTRNVTAKLKQGRARVRGLADNDNGRYERRKLPRS